MAAALGRMFDDSEALKANMSVAFVADNVGRIILYSITGLLTWVRVKEALMLFPAMGLGLALGIVMAGKLSERVVRYCVVGVLVISGMMLIIGNL